MSTEFPRSGIVLYPVDSDFGHMSLPPSNGSGGSEAFQAAMNEAHPDVQPNIARQLGAATNAYFNADNNVQLGTAVAVPYSASIAHELNALRHFESGFLRVDGDAEPILEQERALLDELTESVYRHLQELDLATDGLFATLRDRRIDIIAPSAIGRCDGLAVATRRLLTQRDDFFDIDVIAANTWMRQGRGKFVQFSGSDVRGAGHPATLADNHPLYIRERSHTHTVYTTAATGNEYVDESVVMPSNSTDVWSEEPNGVIRRRTNTVTVTNRISYRIPHDMPQITDSMVTNAMEAAMAPGPDLSDSGLGMFDSVSPPEQKHEQQQATAGQLDPATSSEWTSRIR